MNTETYLLNTALTDTFTGILAMSSPFSVILGSITWHFNIGISFTVTSFWDLKITCTAVCLSWGARVPLEGRTENRLVTLGLAGSAFSNRKLKHKSSLYNRHYLVSDVALFLLLLKNIKKLPLLFCKWSHPYITSTREHQRESTLAYFKDWKSP